MTQFENLLRSGLGSIRTNAEESHLDADQLSAFVEGKMTGPSAVLEHASRCEDCREILFLMSGGRVAAPPARAVSLWRWAWMPAAATICALAIGLPFLFFRRPQYTAPIMARSHSLPGPLRTISPPQAAPERPIAKKAVAPEPARIVDRLDISATGQAPAPPPVDTQSSANFLPAPRRTSQWKLNQGVPEQSTDAGLTWQPASIQSKPHLQSIGSLSSSIWAGGSGGTLLRSNDGGNHWHHIPVLDGTETLTSDVVEVHVITHLQVQIVSADGARWVTNDGGGTWKHEQ